jgi:hypothetical protein
MAERRAGGDAGMACDPTIRSCTGCEQARADGRDPGRRPRRVGSAISAAQRRGRRTADPGRTSGRTGRARCRIARCRGCAGRTAFSGRAARRNASHPDNLAFRTTRHSGRARLRACETDAFGQWRSTGRSQ